MTKFKQKKSSILFNSQLLATFAKKREKRCKKLPKTEIEKKLTETTYSIDYLPIKSTYRILNLLICLFVFSEFIRIQRTFIKEC